MIRLIKEPLGNGMTYQDNELFKKKLVIFPAQQEVYQAVADHYYKHIFKPCLNPLLVAIRNVKHD